MENKKPSPSTIYYGESQCQAKHASGNHAGQQCTNKAYYHSKERYVCGVHSGGSRRKLKPNPHAKEIRAEKMSNHQQTVDAAKAENQEAGQPGKVICCKIGMRTKAKDVPGYLKIFPNYKHQNRKDGFGCASLSPMNLGPIGHQQKDLPPCKCLENYHQFNKVYNIEVDKDKKIKQMFYRKQLEAYKSSTGQRHKYTAKDAVAGIGKPLTLYSVHKDSEGKQRQYTYVQTRYLYCHFYEKLAQEEEDFRKLKEMLKEGTNLQIVGYDGYDVSMDLMEHYRDTSRPFGHEMVLYTLLTVSDSKDYPWNKYYTRFHEIYPSYLQPYYMDSEEQSCLRKQGPNLTGQSSSKKKDPNDPNLMDDKSSLSTEKEKDTTEVSPDDGD